MKSNLTNTQCKRCKKPLVTLVKSITGNPKMEQFRDICKACMTPEEEKLLLEVLYEFAYNGGRINMNRS